MARFLHASLVRRAEQDRVGPVRLLAQSLTLRLGARTLLRDLDCAVEPGRPLAVVGPSGVGKSSLLRVLAGQLRPQGGELRWDEVDPWALAARARRRRRLATIAMLWQDPWLEPRLSTRDNLRLAGAFRRKGLDPARVEHVLSRLGLSDAADRPAASLSGGEAVRCALARCLVSAPAVLLCDEPTAALDPVTAAGVAEVLLGLATEEGLCVVLATHDAALAARCAERLELVPCV